MKKNFFITGPPGVGKTTLIRELAGRLKDRHPAGFYTAEIREKGVRQGFELISLEGRRSLLSHVQIKSAQKVSKYGVDVPGFEAFLDGLSLLERKVGVIIIDEIGKMECFSRRFKELAVEALNSDQPVIATIAAKGDAYIERLKKRADVRLFQVTRSNRDELVDKILAELESQR